MPDHPLVRRRTAVAAVAAAGLLAACDSGEDITPPGSSPSASGDPQPRPEESGGPTRTADELLVDEVAYGLALAVGVLTAARRAPDQRRLLTPLLRAHRRHLEVLTPAGGPPPPVPPGGAHSLRDVTAVERGLKVLLVDAAGRAESGALARLLASVAASVTQHLLVLPPQPATRAAG